MKLEHGWHSLHYNETISYNYEMQLSHPAEPGVLCLQKDELKGLVENIGEPLWLQGFPPEDQAWFHHISTSNRTTQ